jgi:Arc/MetJ family transcription regulator
MRTNVEIDDELLREAMAATGLATWKATVEAALRLVVSQKRRREALRSTAGIGWDGDLEAMRRDGGPPAS